MVSQCGGVGFVGADANIETLYQLAPNCSVVHMVCHGFYDAKDPDYGFRCLNPAQKVYPSELRSI